MIKPHDKNNYKDQLFANYLQENYFDKWKKNEEYFEIEIMVNSKCNLKCKYCYYTTFGDILHPDSIDQEHIISNLDKLLEYLGNNNLNPRINIFSGELFEQKIGHIIIKKIIDFYYKNKYKNNIIIPTNFSFIDTDVKTEKVQDLLEYGSSKNINIILSASFDGKYCDNNRPYRSGFIRTDEWYDKAFTFCKKYGFGFHPMIYFDEINHWKENFIWFTQMLAKYKINIKNLYLLEVRNDGWTKIHNKHLYEFSKFVSEWILKENPDLPIHEIINDCKELNYFNIFGFSSTRALPCSYESNLAIRLADLKIFPCHRLQYPQFETCELCFNKNNILVKTNNIEMYFASNGVRSTYNYPICCDCNINHLCTGGCLGAQFEAMKDPFIPIPSVCATEHAKIKGVLDGMSRDKRFDKFINTRDSIVKKQIKNLLEERENYE
jgi:radical SAM protein with 4Fe4S-binding SPASM domain